MMRFRAIILHLALWMVLTGGSALAGEPEPALKAQVSPRAVFPQVSYNFGEVFEGVEIKHDFMVENQGNAPLVIKSIRPD